MFLYLQNKYTLLIHRVLQSHSLELDAARSQIQQQS